MDSADLESANLFCILESVSTDTLRGLSCDEFDALHNTINDNVLNAGVFSLGILSDKDSIDTVIWGLVASNGATWANIGKEVECAAESKVQGDMTFSDRCLNKFSNPAFKGGLGFLQQEGL